MSNRAKWNWLDQALESIGGLRGKGSRLFRRQVDQALLQNTQEIVRRITISARGVRQELERCLQPRLNSAACDIAAKLENPRESSHDPSIALSHRSLDKAYLEMGRNLERIVKAAVSEVYATFNQKNERPEPIDSGMPVRGPSKPQVNGQKGRKVRKPEILDWYY